MSRVLHSILVRDNAVVSFGLREGNSWVRRLERIRTYVKEDPTVKYDLHAAFSQDPNNVKMEDAYDAYTKIQQAAIRAGKRPPRKKKYKFDAVGNTVGVRYTNTDVPLRIRERLISESMKKEPDFFVGRYGVNKVLVEQIRSAFRYFETVRLEVGSPWTDNTAKFAERLEYRTGAMVLDRSGGRFILYRGFTHADLARKQLLDPECFTVGYEYKLPPCRVQKPSESSPKRIEQTYSQKDLDNMEKTWYKEEMRLHGKEREVTRPEGSTYIDLDKGPEETIKQDGTQEEEERIERLKASIEYHQKRSKGIKPPLKKLLP